MNILFSLILGLSFLGCIEAPDDKLDFGQEHPPEEIATEILTAMGDQGPLSIKVGEFAFHKTYVEVERTNIQLISGESIEIIGKEQVEGDWHVKCTRKFTDYSEKDPKTIVKDCLYKIVIDDQIEQSLSTYNESNEENSEGGEEGGGATHASFHKLEVIKGEMDPPEEVKKDANCKGIKNCRLETTTLKFDLVLWKDSTFVEKQSKTIVISQQAPYMSRILSQCTLTNREITQDDDTGNTRKVSVNYCIEVENFEYGTNN